MGLLSEMFTKIKYPTRCKIIDATGEKFAGYDCKTPEISKPHIGKIGIADKSEGGNVLIKLEDGTILHGYECWWEPIGL